MRVEWYGRTISEGINEAYQQVNRVVFSSIQSGNWDQAIKDIELAQHHPNQIEYDNPSHNSVIHVAARDGVAVEIVQQLLDLKASRMIKNAAGEIPLDIAKKHGHEHLYDILTPVLWHKIDANIFSSLKEYFLQVLTDNYGRNFQKAGYRYPQLQMLLENKIPAGVFHVPYSRFEYWIRLDDNPIRVILWFHNRVWGGSGRLWSITENRYELLEKEYTDTNDYNDEWYKKFNDLGLNYEDFS